MDTMEISVENTRAGKEDQEGPMSNAPLAPFMVAVTQVAPVFLDRSATLEKACELIVDAGQVGARLIVFPTAFIPGYRVWMWQ
jgi:Carbon-nitrogen hydrolase